MAVAPRPQHAKRRRGAAGEVFLSPSLCSEEGRSLDPRWCHDDIRKGWRSHSLPGRLGLFRGRSLRVFLGAFERGQSGGVLRAAVALVLFEPCRLGRCHGLV